MLGKLFVELEPPLHKKMADYRRAHNHVSNRKMVEIGLWCFFREHAVYNTEAEEARFLEGLKRPLGPEKSKWQKKRAAEQQARSADGEKGGAL